MKPSLFISTIEADVMQSCISHRINPSLVFAQAALESGWGESTLAKEGYNLFGIKAARGEGGVYPTSEYINGEWIKVDAGFRHYPSWRGSIIDHAKVLLTAAYGDGTKRYAAIVDEPDYKTVCQIVKDGGYATDPYYVTKLVSVIESNKLYEYDWLMPWNPNYIRELLKMMEPWKQEIINTALEKGIIKEPHNPNEPAPKWFVLKTILNALEKVEK